ncbi:MAG: hypothetical protein EBT38_05165 [Acidimicrobiia bacterium]|nr:hypothetical protein [Acidimicrobiia bacterium]
MSSVLGFAQERGAVRAVQALLGTVSVHADVIRDGREREVALVDVVPGDVVVLRAGDVVPGDCRLLSANHLRLDESSLTGEAFPRHKTPGIVNDDAPLAERTNMAHLGTYVSSGEGRAIVTCTGVETEFGKISGVVARQHLPTSFERGITAFGFMLMRATAVLVTLIFVVNVVIRRPVIDSVLFSLALAVGLTPQMLPAIVTFSLSRGAVAMAKSKVIVKRLDAIEDVGGLDILCTDKTGTITTGSVTVQESLSVDGRSDPRVLRWAWLTARHQKGFPNPLDDAILADRSATTEVSSCKRSNDCRKAASACWAWPTESVRTSTTWRARGSTSLGTPTNTQLRAQTNETSSSSGFSPLPTRRSLVPATPSACSLTWG